MLSLGIRGYALGENGQASQLNYLLQRLSCEASSLSENASDKMILACAGRFSSRKHQPQQSSSFTTLLSLESWATLNDIKYDTSRYESESSSFRYPHPPHTSLLPPLTLALSPPHLLVVTKKVESSLSVVISGDLLHSLLLGDSPTTVEALEKDNDLVEYK